MARITVFCVCAVLLCIVFVNDCEGKRLFSSSRKSSRRTGNKPKPPPQTSSQSQKDNANRHFLDSERNSNHESGQKPQNNGPIGFEKFQNPASKAQAPIGFENINKNTNPGNTNYGNFQQGNANLGHGNIPSAPVMPVPNYNSPHQNIPSAPVPNYNVPHQNIPSAPVMPMPNYNVPHQNIPSAPVMPNSGYHQPAGGNIFSGNQYGKTNANPYQSNPNSGWGNPGNNYPNTGNPYGPQQTFGNNYYGGNPNVGYPSYPNNNNFGNNYGAPNNFGNPGFGNGYNGYPQNNYFGNPGGGNGYGGNSYPGNFGYNNYKPKSRFGLGGLPIPIPIPIPIPFGGFGGFGGSRNNNNNNNNNNNQDDVYSHRVLNTLLNTTQLNSTGNATSIYVINNSTLVSCTNEQFTYGPVNITITACTAVNCTSVKVYLATNATGKHVVNYATLTMCLSPNATVTSNSSDSIKPEVTDIKHYWTMICRFTPNATLNNTGITVNATGTNVTAVSSTLEENKNVSLNGSNMTATALNLTNNLNSTNKLCETLNCSYVAMCLPETEINNFGNSSKMAYKPCVRIKMCKSPNTPIYQHVTLNTTVTKYEEVNNVINKTDSYHVNNITLLTFYPFRNCSMNSTLNDTSCFPQTMPPMNTTSVDSGNNNSTANGCTGTVDGVTNLCNATSSSNTTDSSVSPELLKILEAEASKFNTSISSLLQHFSQRSN